MYLDLKAGKNLARMLRITEVIDAYSSTIKAGLGAHRAYSRALRVVDSECPGTQVQAGHHHAEGQGQSYTAKQSDAVRRTIISSRCNQMGRNDSNGGHGIPPLMLRP
jgi:hypothetical protein